MRRISELEPRDNPMSNESKNREHGTPLRSRSLNTLHVTLFSVVLVWVVAMATSPIVAFDGDDPTIVDSATDSDETRMALTVVDANNDPIHGAKVHANISTRQYVDEKEVFPSNLYYQTAANGTVKIRRPKKLRMLRMWITKPGYVPLFTHWEEGQHDDGKDIPSSHQVTIEKGVKIGGRLVDQNGRSIAGASIDVRADVPKPARRRGPNSEISIWLSDDDVVTDADGKWSINNAPSERDDTSCDFRLRVTHPRGNDPADDCRPRIPSILGTNPSLPGHGRANDQARTRQDDSHQGDRPIRQSYCRNLCRDSWLA